MTNDVTYNKLLNPEAGQEFKGSALVLTIVEVDHPKISALVLRGRDTKLVSFACKDDLITYLMKDPNNPDRREFKALYSGEADLSSQTIRVLAQLASSETHYPVENL